MGLLGWDREGELLALLQVPRAAQAARGNIIIDGIFISSIQCVALSLNDER
jgi:hypothetical protein